MQNFYIIIGPKGVGKNKFVQYLQEKQNMVPATDKLNIDEQDVAIVDIEKVAGIKRNYNGNKEIKVCGLFCSDKEFLLRNNKEDLDEESRKELKRFWGSDLMCNVYLNVENYETEDMLHNRLLKWILWEEEYTEN